MTTLDFRLIGVLLIAGAASFVVFFAIAGGDEPAGSQTIERVEDAAVTQPVPAPRLDRFEVAGMKPAPQPETPAEASSSSDTSAATSTAPSTTSTAPSSGSSTDTGVGGPDVGGGEG